MATGLTVHGSEFTKFEYSKDGTAWIEIPGVSGYSESGGEAPERDIVAFSGIAKRSGHPRVPSIELQAVYQPAHAAWKEIRNASIAGTVLQFRVTTKEDEILPAASSGDNKAGIAQTTGVVTFAGTNPDLGQAQYGVGQALKIGGKNYVIDSISDADPAAVKVKPAPGVNVEAGYYSIALPALRRGPFPATVRIAGNVSLESEGDMTTTLALAPRGQLPEWTIV